MTEQSNALREALAEHFPTGLRSTRHYLKATGEVFESPIQCECHCGEAFAGTDEQEVRFMWAEHVAALAALASTAQPAEDGPSKATLRMAQIMGVEWSSDPKWQPAEDGLVEVLRKALPLLDDLEVGQDCEEYAYAKGKGFQAMTYCPEAFEALRCIPAILAALQSKSEGEAW